MIISTIVIQIIIIICSIVIFFGVPLSFNLLSNKIITVIIKKRGLSVNKKVFIPLGENIGTFRNEVENFKTNMVWLRLIFFLISIPVAMLIWKIFIYYVVNIV